MFFSLTNLFMDAYTHRTLTEPPPLCVFSENLSLHSGTYEYFARPDCFFLFPYLIFFTPPYSARKSHAELQIHRGDMFVVWFLRWAGTVDAPPLLFLCLKGGLPACLYLRPESCAHTPLKNCNPRWGKSAEEEEKDRCRCCCGGAARSP